MAKRLLSVQRIVNLSGDPASGNSGELYYNTGENGYKFYNGSAWTSLGSGGGSGVEVSATIPTVGSDGSLYFNTSDYTLNIALGGAWLQIGSVASINAGNAETSTFDGVFDGGLSSTSVFDITVDGGSSESSTLLA